MLQWYSFIHRPYVLHGANIFCFGFSLVELTSLLTNSKTPFTPTCAFHSYKCESGYASTSPRRRASSARTSVTYCNASNMGIRCSRPLSVGSLIQPSIGIALSKYECQLESEKNPWLLTYPRERYSSSGYCPRSSLYSDPVPQS